MRGLPLGYELIEAPRQSIGFTAPPPEPRREDLPEDGLICDLSESSHALICAPTGAGKGVCVLLPWILSYSGSMVVFDPKGEALAVCARFRASLGRSIRVVSQPSSRAA